MSRPVKIALIVVAGIVGIYVAASYALTGLTSARIQGNESSAIGAVRAVQSAQAVFASSACRGLYAPRLTALAADNYVSPDLAVADVVQKAGYRITLRAAGDAPDQAALGPACAGASTSFVVTAEPVEPGESGIRYFRGTEEGGVVEATTADFSDARPVN
jgi:hypothetical protein